LLGVGKQDILFIGDRLNEGGNDFPVKAFGIDCVHIESWKETRAVVEAINKLQ
jgi:phosphomannomutase